MLQDPGRLAAEAVPDQVDGALLSPICERSDLVSLAVAGVAVGARVLLAVAHGTALQLVEDLTSPAPPVLASGIGGRKEKQVSNVRNPTVSCPGFRSIGVESPRALQAVLTNARVLHQLLLRYR